MIRIIGNVKLPLLLWSDSRSSIEIVDDLDPTDDCRVERIELFRRHPIFGMGFVPCLLNLISLQEVASDLEAGDVP